MEQCKHLTTEIHPNYKDMFTYRAKNMAALDLEISNVLPLLTALSPPRSAFPSLPCSPLLAARQMFLRPNRAMQRHHY